MLVDIKIKVLVEPETDGRWTAEIEAIPGCLAYGDTRHDAIKAVTVLALKVLSEQVREGEIGTYTEVGGEFSVNITLPRN